MNESARAPRFVFEGVGSRGDVVPLMTLAAELVRRGHACRLLANEHFRAEASAQGIAFFGTTEGRLSYTDAEGHALGTYLYPAFAGVSGYFRRSDAFDAGTVVVNIDRWAASEPFAEAQRLRTVRLHLSPFKLRSLASPTWPLGANVCGLLAETYRNYTLPALYRSFDTEPKVLAHLNGIRTQVGLPSVQSALCPEAHVAAQVALFPEWFGAPAADWPSLEPVGFPLPRSDESLPPRLREFLSRAGKPIVFTPGTSVGQPQPFFEAAADCVAELGMRAIFLSPFLQFSSQRFGDRIVHCEHIELEPLLRHCSLLVHHGGVGTTARALQAGLPQVITPAVFDQFDNAHRVESLGLGRVLPRARLSGGNLADLVRGMLADASLAARLQQRRTQLADGDAIRRCADLLEGVLEQPTRVCLPVSELRSPAATDESAPDRVEAASVDARRPIVFVFWPEHGHFVGPLALARRLTAQGRRVVFAGAAFYRAQVEAAGFELLDLSGPPGRELEFSVFSRLPGREALPAAVASLIDAFDFLLSSHDPGLVLIDSLYSAFALLAEARGLPWATYETDLPRELDLGAPPPVELSTSSSAADATIDHRRAWAHVLWQSYRRRRDDKRLGRGFAFAMDSYFPDALCSELQRQLGVALRFERRSCYPPVAVGPRLVLCSPELDFERATPGRVSYLGPCIDLQRDQPDHFPWSRLPPERELVYCSLGTQSLREPRALRVLQTIVSGFSRPSSYFLVIVCPQQHQSQLRFDPACVLVVNEAPQLKLLARARLAIHHGGFNTVKECAFFGVPQLVVPLSHDQFRNAALVRARGIGRALDARTIAGGELMATVRAVREDSLVHERCLALRGALVGANSGLALEDAVDRLEARRDCAAVPSRVSARDTERDLLEAVYRHTDADAAFSEQLECILESVRQFMRVPAQVSDACVRDEFQRLRAQLDTFRVEFRARHAEVVRARISMTRLPELVRALELGNVAAFRDVLDAVHAGRGEELGRLRERMATLPLYGRPKPRGRRSPPAAGTPSIAPVNATLTRHARGL